MIFRLLPPKTLSYPELARDPSKTSAATALSVAMGAAEQFTAGGGSDGIYNYVKGELERRGQPLGSLQPSHVDSWLSAPTGNADRLKSHLYARPDLAPSLVGQFTDAALSDGKSV